MDRRKLLVSGLVTLGVPSLVIPSVARAQQPTQLPPAEAPPPPNSQPAYPSAGPTGGEFTGQLAIEGNRFVLTTVQVTPGNGNPIRFHGRPAPEP